MTTGKEFKTGAEEAKADELIDRAGNKSFVGETQSINDLREKEYGGEKLSKKEKLALKSFDKYRIAILNKQENEGAFHRKYFELQAMANLTPYEEFLKESYLVL